MKIAFIKNDGIMWEGYTVVFIPKSEYVSTPKTSIEIRVQKMLMLIYSV
jgi:hypothetical protein